MTETARPRIVGARYAFQVVRPGSPMLRIRYRAGVAIGPHGFPDWIPYARAQVELPSADPALGVDELRVLDVLTATEAVARSGDPLFGGTSDDGTGHGGYLTPAGWVWAHLASTRRVALVPAELHGAFRHLGGVSTGDADRARRGLIADASTAPPIRFDSRLADEAVRAIEQRLGIALPPAYREFLARTNGGRPAWPAVHPGFGFVADQPFFGAARQDWLQDLGYANGWFGDRLTADWLAVGYVQGGLIAVRVAGGDEGSVWYYDDDDPRGTDDDTADHICAGLLHRCADDFASFWRALRAAPADLRQRARAAADRGDAVVVHDERQGASLPATRRAPGRAA